MAAPTRPRVLIINEIANPEWVSVPLVGWSIARGLDKVTDVHMLTQIRNREPFLRAGLTEGKEFTVIDNEGFARKMHHLAEALRMGKGKGFTTLQAINTLITYPLFERLVWKEFGDSIKNGEWDIVHRVTPLSPTIVSPLAKKCARAGVPFVVGPVNGGVPWPSGFDTERRREREWLSYIRSAYKYLPGRRTMWRNTAAVMVGSRHTASEMPAEIADRMFYMPENGINPDKFSDLAPHRPGKLRACFIGRLVPYKGPDILIDAAMPLLKSGQMTLEMIGDGPMMEALQTQVRDAGVADAVTFHGWVEHGKVPEILLDCHVLSFPSIREFGGAVVLEAMAMGVPALIVDYAGPGELVVDGTGVKVPCTTREGITESFRTELTQMAQDPSQLAAMGARARERVMKLFPWDAKVAQIMQVYKWVLEGQQSPAPVVFDAPETPELPAEAAE